MSHPIDNAAMTWPILALGSPHGRLSPNGGLHAKIPRRFKGSSSRARGRIWRRHHAERTSAHLERWELSPVQEGEDRDALVHRKGKKKERICKDIQRRSSPEAHPRLRREHRQSNGSGDEDPRNHKLRKIRKS